MKKILYFLFLSLFVFSSCNQEDEINDTAVKGKHDKVTICHKGKIISINGNALKAHLKHGDVQLIDADGDGWVTFENECVSGGDCDDTNPEINPGMVEICGNEIDDDCDGDIDEDCWTYVPDDDFEQRLICLGYDDVLDDYVLTANIINVEELTINEEAYTSCEEPNGPFIFYDLTGIEDFKALKKLEISETGATFDLSGNINLEEIFMFNVYTSDHKDLDFSKNIALKKIDIVESIFESINLSENVNLTSVSLDQLSELASLNLKNGNNYSLNFTMFSCTTISCIQVDDVDYSNANWEIFTSPLAFFSEDCGY